MAYKTVCMIVTDAETDAAVIDAAVAFADRHGAHLDITCLGIDPARYEAMPAGAVALALDSGAVDAHERAEALAGWAERRVGGGQVARCTVQPMVVTQPGLDFSIARIARYVDIVVAGQPYGPGRVVSHAAIVEATIFGTQAPVLIVPDGQQEAGAVTSTAERPLLAWNESDEALAAIRQAIPMLQAARHVDVVMVDPPTHSAERSDPGGAVSLMLARHGVRAEVSILARTMPTVADVVKRFATEHGNDLIVMGAYGHSRFREAVFGGATRDMLDKPTLPLLMAH